MGLTDDRKGEEGDQNLNRDTEAWLVSECAHLRHEAVWVPASTTSSTGRRKQLHAWCTADRPRRKLNESPTKVEDPAVLRQPLTEPKLKKITLHFPLGLEVVARNMKGVTIKDALDAIHKQFKKRVCVLSSLLRPYSRVCSMRTRPLLSYAIV